jgi:oxygen-independent coproporphyrinogen-3 oxidase
VNTIEWDGKLIEKYDVAGPRYTSYPTAPNFSSDFELDTYIEDAQNRANHREHPLSLYLHIPFCNSICYYCGCNKIVTRDKTVTRRYLDYLFREIHMQGELWGSKRPVSQLHFGGGTPTFLSDGEFSELMYTLARNFKLGTVKNSEYSIEIDPRTVDTKRLGLFKGLGINRLSLGVQDFDERVQKAVNRVQSYESIRELVEAARSYRFDSISFDLIYGLPHQSTQSLAETIAKVVALAPDRIAFYNYAHLPERFSSQRAIDRLTLPSAAEKIAMLELISQSLRSAGYLHVGMDHYVTSEDSLAKAQKNGRLTRNFQGYSLNKASDLIGIGVSSIGSSDNLFVQNEKQLDTYYAALDEGRLPIAKGLKLNDDDKLRREVILDLSCNLYLDIRSLEDRWGIEFFHYFSSSNNHLSQLEKDGAVQISRSAIVVTELGRSFLRNICMCFDAYLNQNQNIQFSRAL